MKAKLFNRNVTIGIFTILLFAVAFTGCKIPQSNVYEADVIIYGGTSAAVIAAVEVAHSGKSVIMVSPDIYLGSLSAGGLGWSDTGEKEVIGGLAIAQVVP